jgi:hypothetical protein
LLVVAVVGGTNIGKSLVFNLLAGENASAVSPLAAGTRHPVCLVPPDFVDEEALTAIFTGFALRPWQSADDPLSTADENLLFWRSGTNVPPRLLLLDTPDVDSDVPVNWQRADTIRQAADVLLAILTQQKYNDAAVKQFFRHAAEADKPVIVIFNQCDVVDDAGYWPLWLETFCRETGVLPELVYVVPYDRRGAAALDLPIYSVGVDGRAAVGEPNDLRAELGALRFDQIKIRTLRGALRRLLDPRDGCSVWLERLRQASRGFANADRELDMYRWAQGNWPPVPLQLLVDEIAGWWDAGRAPWFRALSRGYRAVGRGVVWPLRAAWQGIAGPPRDLAQDFIQAERSAILAMVEAVFEQMDRLAQVGNEILRPRLQKLLAGHARAELIERLEQAYDQLPLFDDDYRNFLHGELDRWRHENPRTERLLRSFDYTAGVARPVLTVSLAAGGVALAGGMVHGVATEAAAQATAHTAAHYAAEAAIAGSVTAGGEALVGAAGAGIKQGVALFFLRLQKQYARRRADWLASWLETNWLHEVRAELRQGAEVVDQPAFAQVGQALAALSSAELR